MEDSSRPKLIHWMTLNSRLPVRPVHLPDESPCSTDLGLQSDTPLCSWYQLITNVHRSVAQLAMDRLGRPTIFVVVGDHAPPFGNPTLHNAFSNRDVPYVVLLPRSEHPMLARNPMAPNSASDRDASQTP